MNRRSFVKSAGLFACMNRSLGFSQAATQTAITPPLKATAARTGRKLGVFGGAYLPAQPALAAVIAREFSMIGDGNDLKFSDRLRPTPDTFNFAPGDMALDWAQTNGLAFRGHTLIWWNALPKWFNDYVTPDNAKKVMVDHITTVMKHYAGKMYSWDVVNEAIYHDNRPDGLRIKPWLQLVGPDYIDIAFHTAREADPKARLVYNECYVEHNTPGEIMRRDSLLQLATRMKAAKVPLDAIGLQGHIRGSVPIDDAGMLTFLKQIHDLGLEIMITELDVDDVGVQAPMIDSVVASKYAEFLDLVGPFASSISFQSVADNSAVAKRPDGLSSRPNLFDVNFQQKPSYQAVAASLNKLPKLPAMHPGKSQKG